MKISKRVREEAALICQGYASAPGWWTLGDCVDASGAGSAADALAMLALFEVAKTMKPRVACLPHDRETVCGAEAEALLRTGWAP